MGTQKMSLANIQGKLSRAEMKDIMAGSGTACSCHAHYNSNGSLHSYGWNLCGGDANPAGTTCRNYNCSTGAFC